MIDTEKGRFTAVKDGRANLYHTFTAENTFNCVTIMIETTAATSAVSMFNVFRSEAQSLFCWTVRLLTFVIFVKSEKNNPSAVVVVVSRL